MDGNSWENFIFKFTRTDTGVGDDTLGGGQSGDTAGTEKYPFLTCEVGGGMPASYHRRMNYDPRDVEAVALCQLGSGSSLMGYYMFHGGQNPDGKLSTLQESSATGYPNDLPVKNYDFNAPIGEYGQLNPQYYWLRRLHLFLHDFGGPLAQMPLTLPDVRPTNKTDFATLRWAVRSDGDSGYVFVNNYQRLQPMSAKKDVQFKLNLPGGELVFPSQPVTIPADQFFFWPFNLDLGGAKLIYATAQPIFKMGDGNVRTIFFAETPNVPAQFVFDGSDLAGQASSQNFVCNVKPSQFQDYPVIRLTTKSGTEIHIVLFNEADSLALRIDDELDAAGKLLTVLRFDKNQEISTGEVKTELLQPAGPAREILMSTDKSHIALAPTDSDFTNAAVWKIQLPNNLDLNSNPLLRIRYVGDVARLTLNGKLIEDDFYSGRDFEIGLKRYAPDVLTGDLQLQILPLRKGAPVFFEPKTYLNFDFTDASAKLKSVVIVSGN